MKKNASPHASLETRFRLVPMFMLAAAATLFMGLVGTASAAAPIGKDGSIHACYRVKGKPKGGLRVVSSAKKRCKRGERKVTWSVAGSGGQTGGSGQSAQGGASGQSGANGTSSSNEAVLKTQVASLALKMDGLEETLNGISHGDLAGSLATLNGLDNTKLLDTVDAVKGLTSGDLNGAVDAVAGLTNTDLTDAVASLPAVDLLCEQNSELAKQVNLLQGVIGGLGLSSGLEALGLLKIPTLPTALSLEEFGCPAP